MARALHIRRPHRLELEELVVDAAQPKPISRGGSRRRTGRVLLLRQEFEK
jgi:hypothetical protein